MFSEKRFLFDMCNDQMTGMGSARMTQSKAKFRRPFAKYTSLVSTQCSRFCGCHIEPIGVHRRTAVNGRETPQQATRIKTASVVHMNHLTVVKMRR